MDKNKIKKWSLIIVGALNLFLLTKVVSTNNKLENMEYTLSNLQSSIYNVDSSVNNLQNIITEQDNFIANITNEVNPSDISINGYLLKSSISFKEVEGGEEPYVVYRAVNNNLKQPSTYSEWTSVKLEKTAPLSYEVSLALNYSYDYEYKVVTQGVQERSSGINYLSSQEYAPIKMEANEFFTKYNGKNNITGLFINVYSQYQVKGFEVDKVVVKVISSGKEYIAEKVLQNDEEYGYVDKPGVIFERYKIEIVTKDLPNENVGYLPISIELTCKNGFKILDDRQNLSYTN